MRLEVRCCCDPEKLFGWLPVPDGVHDGSVIQLVVSRARWVLERPTAAPSFEPPDVIALPVATVVTDRSFAEPHTRLALKSEETPLERLRLIPGFEEYIK